MNPTESKLAAAIEAVNGTLAHHRAIYTNGKALTARADKARAVFMNRVMATSGEGEPLNISRGHPEVETLLGMDATARYLATKGIAEAVTTSPEYAEAVAHIEPLIATVRELEAQLIAENEAAAVVAQARRDAIEQATAEALADVEKRFALPEPEPSPEPPAPPFRGRNLKPALATV